MNPTHTPTPWRLLDNTGNGRNLVHVECEETLDPVCSIPKARIADAELIVRAVNMHSELVWAARVALDYLGEALANEPEDYENHELADLVKRLEAVVAQTTNEGKAVRK
jgi:hypothetical protein